MIQNAEVNKQKTSKSLNNSKLTAVKGNEQQTKNAVKQEVEVLAQYHTAIENGSLEHQILSQRGRRVKGYKGF